MGNNNLVGGITVRLAKENEKRKREKDKNRTNANYRSVEDDD